MFFSEKKEDIPLPQSKLEEIKTYILNNPSLIYKGIPLVMSAYILSPVFFLTWQWLPWLWACYELYTHIPEGTVPLLTGMVKLYMEDKNEILKD